MNEYFLVFIFQLTYIIVKFMGIRFVVGDNLPHRLVMTSLASTIWLVTTSLGVKEMIDGNYLIIVPYILGSITGVVLEHYIRRKI